MALRGQQQALEMLADVRTFADSPRLQALSHVQEAVVHVACSEWRPALHALELVGPGFALLTPREQTAALLNGGLAHLSLLELEPARGELRDALQLAVEHHSPEQEFKARHNLGCLEFYAGRLPEAIALMREADEMDVPVDRARAKHDLALVLLEAGLVNQARQSLTAALDQARAERLRLQEGDVLVDLARCDLLQDDLTGARTALGGAVRAYRARGAHGRERSTVLLRTAVAVAGGRSYREVDAQLQPWLDPSRPVTPDERLAARVLVEVRLLRGDVVGAAHAVDRLRGRAPQGLAADMHDRLLVARVAAARGDAASARRTVRGALHRLMARQEPTQSLEVRSALALHGRRLSEFEIDDALHSGSLPRVFDSVEHWRAISHRLPPVAAPADPVTSELLAELRQARRLLTSGPDDAVAQEQRARAAHLEWLITQRDWSREERLAPLAARRAVTLSQTRDALAARQESALVFFASAGTQLVLQVDPHRTRLVRLGALSTVTAAVDRLRRDLRAHSFTGTHPALEQVLRGAVTASLAELDRLLMSQLTLRDGTGVVVIPGRALGTVPWGMLPSLAGRPVTVATSATRWCAGVVRDADATGLTSVVALAGPDLRRATEEVDGVARAWATGAAAVESRPQADSNDVKAALASATLVHVAAHGHHEVQSPYFSSLRMSDGPVFAHELPRPLGAEHVVLSACDVGTSDLRVGDEPLGLTAALQALGVPSVVAAVSPVDDAAAAAAMVDYHGSLANGESAAVALAATIAEHPGAGAFCLYGSDWVARPGG